MPTTLTSDRNTIRRSGERYSYPMAAATTLYKGGMVALDVAGNAIAPTLAINQIIVGICLEDVVNAGAAAAANVEVGTGVFRLDNFGAITKASIGDIVYCHDDVSVQASGTGASPAGKMVDIDSTGVWVELYCPDPAAAVAGALLAANNLNDVNTNLTALNNLLGGTAKLIAAADALDTTDASVFTLGATTATGMSLARTGQLTEIKGGLKVDQAVELVGIVQHDAAVNAAGASTYPNLLQTKAATYTVQTPAIDGDCTIQDLTDGAVITLPATAAANKGMKVTLQNTAANGAALVGFAANAADTITGSIGAVNIAKLAGAATLVNTKATAIKGNYATIQSDGAGGWWIVSGVGVWA